MYADENVIRIKHDVLYEVAKLAFEGTLEEERDHLPRKMIPGPTPQFRCCVYKEREIIRQRIRLAEGKAPGPEDNGNVVQVLFTFCIGIVFGFSKYKIKDCGYVGVSVGHGLYDFLNTLVRMFIV